MGLEILRGQFQLLIPILGMLIPIVAIVAYYVNKNSSERERHTTMRELVRNGQPIPPELLGSLRDFEESDYGDTRNQRSLVNTLRGAVINISVGVGLMSMFFVMRPNSWLWALGLIPACLGMGLLLLWWVGRPPAAAKPAV